MLESVLHSEYVDAEGRLVLFRCRECGYTSMSLGTLHAHAERHRGYTRFGIQLPFTSTWMGNFEALMEYTDILAVDGEECITLDDVKGL